MIKTKRKVVNMKRIALSLMTIAAVAVMATSATSAYFSDQIEVRGITFSAGNADLNITDDSGTPIGSDSIKISTLLGNNVWPAAMYPGFSDWGQVNLSNNSTANIKLDVTGKLTAADGWNDSRLKEAIYIRVVDKDTTVVLQDYHNLIWWNAADRLLVDDLTIGSLEKIKIEIKVATNYASDGTPVGNEVANKALTNIKFVLTGTQSH
jgi:hypothetical protein